jgi:hypothetical protein
VNMMLRNTVLAGVLVLGFSGAAFAQSACPCGGGTRVLGTDIVTLLAGKKVCAVLGSERWQEIHQGSATPAGGPLAETGSGSPEVIGSWSVLDVAVGDGSTARVRYDYGSGGAYEYAVCTEGGSSVHFCGASFGGRNVTNASLVGAAASCGAP